MTEQVMAPGPTNVESQWHYHVTLQVQCFPSYQKFLDSLLSLSLVEARDQVVWSG